MVHQFKIGDLVQLKSGGSALRVEECLGVGDDGGAYRCQWSDGSTLKQGVFLGISLRKFEGSSPKDSQDGLADRMTAANKRVERLEAKRKKKGS
jgi:uncharacterized protein YodC (DUF2158 family)